MTPRAIAAPAVNEMLARLLPAPDDIVVRVGWVDRLGAAGDRLVSQADLGLQAIDLVHLLHLGGQTLSELDERILLHVTAAEGLPPDVSVTATIRYTEREPGRTTLFEASALVEHLRALVTRSRPLQATDVVPPTEAVGATDEAGVEASRARPVAVRDALEAERVVAAGIVADLDDPATDRAALLAGVDGFVDRTVAGLRGAGAFALPGSGWGGILERRRDLFAQLLDAVDEVVERWTRRLADADAQLAADAALPVTASDEERNRLLLLAEGAISTSLTDPLPADADGYRTAVAAKRTAFAQRLGELAGVRPASASLAGALAAVAALLPLSDFDPVGLDLTPVEDAIVALAGELRVRAAAVETEAARRIAAADALVAEHDALAPGRARADALVAATKALLGEDAVVVPEFTLAPELGDEWEAAMAWSRTGQLTAHASTTRELPVDDWLHGVARVREKLRALEQAILVAGALGSPEPELRPIQLPHADEPWLALELPPGLAIPGERVLYTAHYPVAFDKSVRQCGLLVDEWTESIPGETETTGLALHHDAPDCEAPQSWLLAVSPRSEPAWSWDDLVATLHDTLDLARSRAIEPEQVDATPFASFLPATVMAATVSGVSISVNLAVNNGLLAQLRRPDG